MSRRRPAPTKVLRMAMMRDVPVGHVFLLEWTDPGKTAPDRALYIREPKEQVRCLVNSNGDRVEARALRINGQNFELSSLVVHIPPEDQVRRHMLAVHGLGAKAIAP